MQFRDSEPQVVCDDCGHDWCDGTCTNLDEEVPTAPEDEALEECRLILRAVGR